MSKLYLSIEISKTYWQLCFSKGTTKRKFVQLHSTEYERLPKIIEGMKKRLHLPLESEVLSCHEAGLQGTWIHRYLERIGVNSLMVDSASIEVNRRKRRIKTDSVDANKLMNMLRRYDTGEKDSCSVVRVPSPEAEDFRRIYRELVRLNKELTQHNNRIISLLDLHGSIPVKVDMSFLGRLPRITNYIGDRIPKYAFMEIKRVYERWLLTHEQEKKLRTEMRRVERAQDRVEAEKIVQLQRLRGIGVKGSWGLVSEMFGWREFKNRKQVGGYLGLTGTPYNSGNSIKEQGISKAGNKQVRTLMVQLAWLWLRHQAKTDLAKWFQLKTISGSKRIRRVAIVGLARKLSVALWRYVDFGIVPKGAVLE